MSDEPLTAPIVSLSVEVFDEILDHLLESLRTTSDPKPDSGPGKTKSIRVLELERISLVCRQWRGPAQRRIVQKLVIWRGARARRAIAGLQDSGLGKFVREVKMSGTEWEWARGHDVIMEGDFIALLLCLPNLVGLRLNGYPSLLTPENLALLDSRQVSSSLQSLQLFYYRSDKLPALPPNTTPIDFTSLTSLAVFEESSSSLSFLSSFFSTATFSRIQKKIFESQTGDVRPLMGLVSPRLTRLDWNGDTIPERNLPALWATCPNSSPFMHELFIPSDKLSKVPRSLSAVIDTLITDLAARDDGDLFLRCLRYARPNWPAGITKLKIECNPNERLTQRELYEVERFCAEAGLELTGVTEYLWSSV